MAHELGTRIKFSNAEELKDVTNGKEYTISGRDWDGDEYFIDDVGERNYATAGGVYALGKYVIVTE